MDVMRRAAAVLAVLALAGADAAAKTEPLYGLVGKQSGMALVELDPETLRPVPGRRLRLGPATATATTVRAGDLAYADGYRLRLIDLETMKSFASVRVIGMTRAVVWPEWQRILVLSGGEGLLELTAVDRSLMRVTRRTLVRGTLIDFERTATGLVLLVAPQYVIGPARLVIVDARARVREVELARVIAGWRSDEVDPSRGESRSPGLAFDPERAVAYVAGADGVVAEIPIGRAPRYHAVRGRYHKTIAGWWRTAEWLGGGVLAVAGSDSADGRSSQPSGVELVDTRRWTSRFVLPGATNVVRWRDGVLATGSPWDEATGAKPGIGLVAIGRDGSERLRLLPGERAWVAGVTATRAYVAADGADLAYVVDLLGGRILTRVNAPLPWLLPTQPLVPWP
jgi:hypothetical protein